VRSRLLPAIWIVPVFVAAGLIFLRRAGLHYDASSELAGYPATLCLLSDGDLPRYDISFTLIQPSESERSWVAGLIAVATFVPLRNFPLRGAIDSQYEKN